MSSISPSWPPRCQVGAKQKALRFRGGRAAKSRRRKSNLQLLSPISAPRMAAKLSTLDRLACAMLALVKIGNDQG